ncbi:MAG TPA: YibE/F family protein, partial [bacterium]|nr:YibE/F family protein [bacterium]
MKKIIAILAISLFLMGLPQLLLAQNIDTVNTSNHPVDELFTAEVIKIIEEKEVTRENGSTFYQQNLELKGLEHNWKDKTITYQGISEMDLIGLSRFEVGDKVMVQKSSAPDSEDQFFITDYVRKTSLYWLIILFVIIILIIGKKKGFKSLIGLIISFLIIIKLMLPQILAGRNPILVGIIG